MKWLLSLLFPVKCLRCGVRGTALCNPCITTIPFAEAIREDKIFAVFDYGNRTVQKIIHTLKYHHSGEAAKLLVAAGAGHINEYISEILQSGSVERVVLVPIPQHPHKDNERGFNQSERIAAWLAPYIPGATVAPVIKKVRPTVAQARIKYRGERRKNLIDSMQSDAELDPKTLYLVIDDVTTTGATVVEAGRALRAGGARKILSIALAHGYKRP